MGPIYKEASFPAYYREAEVGHIMGAVYKLRSIAITGLAGMGKSNVVRFIVSHPQARSRYLKERADDYAFVHVDCAGLAHSDEAGIVGEIAAQLSHDGIAPPTNPWPQAPRSMRRMLRELILDVQPNLNLVLGFDYFDQAAAQLDQAFFNYLFHLRNTRPRGNLSYIFATRRPMGHLHELHELLDDGCTVGPLSTRDALDSIRRDEARLGCTFDQAQRETLAACTGGHPGFLKNATESLSRGQIDTTLPTAEIARQLLQSERLQNLCRELWNDLTPDEQTVLSGAATGAPPSRPRHHECVAFLERNGLLVRREIAPGELDRAIFCPLFETFVRQVMAAGSGTVRITAVYPNQARIETPAGEERMTISPRLFALLLALNESRGHVLPTDEIISRVYGSEADGVTNAALSQLVKRLRGTIDPRVQRMIDDHTYTCVETIRNVGYRFTS